MDGSGLGVVSLIQDAVQALERHPLIGRTVEDGLSELVISYGKTGFVTLHDFRPEHDVVSILALGHRRESGFPYP